MNAISTNGSDRLTVQEAANYLRLSKATLDIWRSQKKGPAYLRAGARIFYRKDELDTFLDSGIIRPDNR